MFFLNDLEREKYRISNVDDGWGWAVRSLGLEGRGFRYLQRGLFCDYIVNEVEKLGEGKKAEETVTEGKRYEDSIWETHDIDFKWP